MSWLFLASRNASAPAPHRPASGGFGLIELMVSVSIMAIVSIVVLTQQTAFDGAVLLRSQAYQVAFQIREVQLSAVSASNDANVNEFRSVLGVYLRFDDSTETYEYHIFNDSAGAEDPDGFYDDDEKFGAQPVLDNRFYISDIRDDAGVSRDEVSIIFERPNFDAHFFNGANSKLDIGSIKFDIKRRGATGTGNGDLRTIEITRTGQIAVQ